MSAPNLLALTTATGKNYSCAVGTTRTDLVPTVTTGHAVKINAAAFTNIHGTDAGDVTLELYDSSANVYYKMLSTVSIPADAVFSPKELFPLYLEEGDKLTVLANTASVLQAVASGEDLS